MAIDLGDATLAVTGDTSQPEASFTAVGPIVEKAFGQGSEAIDALNAELDATGENVAFAGEQIASLTQVFRTLGVQGLDLLKSKLDAATGAFATLQDAGVTAQGTLLQAPIKLTEREIAYRTALGQTTAPDKDCHFRGRRLSECQFGWH